jgi:hypothetical protein
MQEWPNRLQWVMLVRDERLGTSVHSQVRPAERTSVCVWVKKVINLSGFNRGTSFPMFAERLPRSEGS